MNVRTRTMFRHNWWMVAVAIALVALMAFSVQTALASDGTFSVSVYHGIDGRRLGLSQELPVNVWIMKEGVLFAKVNDITYQERFEAQLPAGEYTIMIESVELGAVIDSMTTGPVDFSEGDDLRIRANLGVGKIPILTVRAR
jgi:CRISPR/Cas system-associated exonuclease Cas4 (RecB family)